MVLSASGVGAGYGGEHVAATAPGGNGGGHRFEVTLLTGDTVLWEVLPEGYRTATLEETRAQVSYQTIEAGDDYYVIPSDVEPLLDSTLDRELFNVAGLVEQGYHNAAVDGLPVILTGDSDGEVGALDALPGLAVERALPSVSGVAGHVDRDGALLFGALLTQAGHGPVGALSSGPLAGVDKIWLDRQVQVHLEDSVPQTGAPQAWQAGFDGTGTTIAVLDTGIDETHADIGDAVIAAQNFSAAEGPEDGHGHGTHVAATAAGTGAASNGLRPGMAPGAHLVNAKVLDDEGNGQTSGIIAGMEWAAEQDVDVINMSLGGGATDGTDPLSQAVNTITEEQDVLFVIAAGNTGPSEGTVGSPGSADAALTVGAVDKDGELAEFSGRGPRVGDFAIKPDITAPGVGIVAARAAGTSMGFPVDEEYTSSSGTSMAAPHVAGAVAILAQQHPNWTAATRKAALVNSAVPHQTLTVYEQGGGELDAARALDATVVSTPSTLDLGYFAYPHDGDPTTETLTYTNLGDEAVTLDLVITLFDEEGIPTPEDMVTVHPTTVALEPGASSEVEVTVDSSLGGESLFSGVLVATDADGERRVGTPTGLHKEGEMYDITVEGLQRDGRPAARGSSLDVIDATGTEVFEASVPFVNGSATVRVPPGTYSVMGVVTTVNEADENVYEAQVLLGDPELAVAGDVHLVWDSRDAAEITVDTPFETTTEFHSIHYHRTGGSAGDGYTHTWNGAGDWPYYSVETDPVTLGEFAFGTTYEMSAPEAWLDLSFGESDAIPADLSYHVTEDTMSTVETAYHSSTPDHALGRTHSGWRPYQRVAYNLVRSVLAPQVRVEYVTANDTRWQKQVRAAAPSVGAVTEPMRYYQPGAQLEQSWFASPSTPSLDEGNEQFDGPLPSRRGDLLNLFWTYEWGDSNSGDQPHFGERHSSVDSTAFRLYQDGVLAAEDSRALGEFEVAHGDSRLRMELDVAREADWWTTSTQTHTAWEFDSTTTQTDTPLPLLQIDYDLGLTLANELPHPRDRRGPATFSLDVRHPAGIDSPQITGAQVWLSYDDGQSWMPRPVRATGDGTFEVVVDRRGGGDHASIRVEAWDAAGNQIEQEVIRAYAVRR